MLNSVNLVGNVGGDPDVRYFDSGSVKVAISLAVGRAYKKEGQPDTDWFRVEAWSKTAEVIANHVRKGNKLGITGRLETKSWNDKNTGQQRSMTVVVAERVALLTPKQQQQQPAPAPQYAAPVPAPMPAPAPYPAAAPPTGNARTHADARPCTDSNPV